MRKIMSELLLLGLLCTVANSARGQSFSILYNFQGGTSGENPPVGLTIDAGGNLYGADQNHLVYRLSHKNSGWVLNPLYYFGAPPDGNIPTSRPVFGPQRRLYGVTGGGGTGSCQDGFGCGVVYDLRPMSTTCKTVLCPWMENIPYRFQDPPDGQQPSGDPVFDSAGNLYATTFSGGQFGLGTVYELSPSPGGWTETILYSFTGGSDGEYPYSGVIIDAAGNLYGTTAGVSANACPESCGTVFKLTRSGSTWTETTLHQFSGPDGSTPFGGLIKDSAGNLYGTAATGGPNHGGTVFELTFTNGQWSYNLIYAFTGGPFDSGPTGFLYRDAGGSLYGLTHQEGASDLGTLFKLTPAGGGWTYTDLHDFAGGPTDGAYPAGSPIVDGNGNLVGTASEGGTGETCPHGCGVVWEYTP